MVDIDDNDKGYTSSTLRRKRKDNRLRDDKLRTQNRANEAPEIPLESLCHITGLSVRWVRWDRTQNGWHVVIKVSQKLTLSETIAAQAILGSDRKREMLNLARCISIRKRPSRYWEQRANILYEKKLGNKMS
jgi:hypothetical protein